ncbi:MAG: pentapeptide repeat-containing protein [Pseudomonadota bacterium]
MIRDLLKKAAGPIAWFLSWFIGGPDHNRRIERLFLILFALAIPLGGWGVWELWLLILEQLGDRFSFFDEKTDGKTVADILRNLSFTVAGIIAALFGFFQLHNAARRTRISDDQVRVAFEAERNDRFVKAAQLLKEDSPAVQMAGIEALKRLAREPTANYRRTVVELLAGFIRTETGPAGIAAREKQNEVQALELRKLRIDASTDDDAAEAPPPVPEEEEEEAARTETPEPRPRPSEPVATAFRALTELTSDASLEEREQVTLGRLVDLRRCDLRGLDQAGAKCRHWLLVEANLGNANLMDAKLSGADLWGADLERAKLVGADLRDANLAYANLWGANLRDANLRGATLRDATLRGATLRGAKLWDAKLENANLRDATLDFTLYVKTEQLAAARNVTWPDHVPRPESGPYAAREATTDDTAP